ncbi:hypothetical protein GIB67_014573 [Kingdonia uniflora]|uniref:Serine hydrolase domain-containing protein n=1 Tax=Kingdonia uniflora TaxID=39325 RepID=A0A7J7MP31_9MAGN|nr:hypothetical protein GIB67_014573 [Kingdonia uniflora]
MPILQLYGGIQRYLEQFPDGGFFKGKNFVFDHRMLVLVCNQCQDMDGATYICELCQKHMKECEPTPLAESNKNQAEAHGAPRAVELESNLDSYGTKPPGKLRILCLHGFRQNASSFKGRTSSLAKKLKTIAELVFIDAPHELPFIYHPRVTEASHSSEEPQLHQKLPALENCKKKFAWLVSEKLHDTKKTDWEMTDKPFDHLQYRQQKKGYDVSLTYLTNVFSQAGPFDGVLGFSQGAAMTASLCAEIGRSDGKINFKFAILCSGFSSDSVELEPAVINCPSLHIFGNGEEKDRQISCKASMELASLFDPSSVVIIEHPYGHIIPTQPPYIDCIKAFLLDFL